MITNVQNIGFNKIATEKYTNIQSKVMLSYLVQNTD